MPFQSGVVSVGTTATLICTVGSAPENDGVLISASAAVFIGGPGVTASTGFPVTANTPVTVPTTGAESLALYGITSSSTSNVAYIFPG
jgi:hypothetical protein